MKFLNVIPAFIILGLIIAWILLPIIQEPLRVQSWYSLKTTLRVGGLLVLVGTVVVIFVTRKKPHLLKPVTAFAAMIAMTLPTLSKAIGAAYPANLQGTEPTLTVRLPLNERVIVTWGGDKVKTNYHAATPQQRWAYDMVVKPHGHGAKELSGYGCYGKVIVAPLNGKVIRAVDEDPDQIPSQNLVPPKNVLGNHIMISPESGEGRVLIAHMKPGSLLVQVDDIIFEGDPIGQCGNSGNTSEPHIHIDYAIRQRAKNGLFYTTGLPLYFRDHGGEAMPTGGFTRDGGKVVWLNHGEQHIPSGRIE